MASNRLVTLIGGTSITEPKLHILLEDATLPGSLEPLACGLAPNPGTCTWTIGSGGKSFGPTKLFGAGSIAGPCSPCCPWEVDASVFISTVRDVVLRFLRAGEVVRFLFGPIFCTPIKIQN